MSTTFTPQQIKFLKDWFIGQTSQYVSNVMDDEFEADEDNFKSLCDKTFNVSGFKVGEVVGKDTTKTTKTTERLPKKKVKKDPNLPTRPKSSYMIWLWSEDGVEKVKTDYPSTKSTEDPEVLKHTIAVKIASEKWKLMDDDAKSKWVLMAEQEKIEYTKKLEQYNATKTSEKQQDVEQLDEEQLDEEQQDEDQLDEDQLDVPDGFVKKTGFYINGYHKDSNKGKGFKTFEEASSAILTLQDVGGIVFNGSIYTIRKLGTHKISNKGEILFFLK